MSDAVTRYPLHRLLAAKSPEDCDAAWADFLDQHSKLILHTARRASAGHDDVMDRYTFVLVFEAGPGMRAVGDGTLLRLLLTNLLQNAWKYTGREKETRIELGVVKDADGIATYHVRDNGIGFDNSQRDRIFRAFERLDTGGDFTGSGLGLATVKRIVHRHGGRVWAEGVPREGAVFRFTLASSSTEMSGVIIDRRNNIR
jgi:signal transduction histidine kinase